MIIKVLLYALAEEAVVIAVPIEPAVAAAEEAGFGVAFWVELDDFEAASGGIGHEGDVVGFAHFVVEGDVVLVFDVFYGGGVGWVDFLYFQWRQGDAATADHGRASGLQDVAADRADVEACAHHIGGAVGVDDLLAGEQLGDRNLQRLGEGLKERKIWQAATGFPFGNGFVADVEFFCELRLSEMEAFAKGANGLSSDVSIHGDCSFLCV